MMVERIISGGQTGADQGGLLAARDLGIPTGGYAPRGWLTESGPAADLLKPFGLEEATSPRYPHRTAKNVFASDATVLFGNSNSTGTRLTWRLCRERKHPVYVVSNPAGMRDADIVGFRAWLSSNRVRTLNVAGNRESRNPSIGEAVRRFLCHALREEGAP